MLTEQQVTGLAKAYIQYHDSQSHKSVEQYCADAGVGRQTWYKYHICYEFAFDSELRILQQRQMVADAIRDMMQPSGGRNLSTVENEHLVRWILETSKRAKPPTCAQVRMMAAIFGYVRTHSVDVADENVDEKEYAWPAEAEALFLSLVQFLHRTQQGSLIIHDTTDKNG